MLHIEISSASPLGKMQNGNQAILALCLSKYMFTVTEHISNFSLHPQKDFITWAFEMSKLNVLQDF